MTNFIFTPFQISALITAFISLFSGLFVYFSTEKTRLISSWLLTSIAISMWSIGLFGVVFYTNVAIAWFWQYVLDISAICLPFFYFSFLLHLIKREKELIKIQTFLFIFAILLIVLNFTDFFKVGISPKFGLNYWIDPGELYFLFPLYFFIFVVISTYFIIKEYRLATNREYKGQLKYILLAQTIGFLGGFTDFFPQLFNFYPFGNYFIVLYVIFISYASLKHHLFNIKVIATELLTFAIWITLLIKIFTSNSLQDTTINVIIFGVMVFLGILLIRSVLKEVRQREEIARMAEDVRRAYVIEKKAKEELEKLDKFKDQFLMTTQHNLRAPLTSMMGYSDLLLKGVFGKQTKKTTEVIEKFQVLTQGMIKMVNDFLNMAQFQLGKGVISLKPGIELLPILDEIVGELEFKAKSKGIYLKIQKSEPARNASPARQPDSHGGGHSDAGGKILIKADREKLKAALFNIIDNAVKYTVKGGVDIKVDASASLSAGNNEGVKIIISDTGIGIPKEKLKNLFDTQFERGEEAKKMDIVGSGVGLYLSGQIIKAHNGKVWAESPARSSLGEGGEGEEGKGSVFYVELPTI